MAIGDDDSIRPQYLQDFLLIKDDNKFFSRLLSKENSNKGESSFRFCYYGGSSSSSIPFHWESEPGTPKHSFTTSTLLNPPLTPPPSYPHLQKPQSPSSSRSSSFSMSSMPLFTYSSNPTNFPSKYRVFGSRTGNNSKRFRVSYYSMKKVMKLLLSVIRIRASRNMKCD